MNEMKNAPRKDANPSSGRRSFDEAADGSLANLILTLPRDVTGKQPVQVRCSARVSSRQDGEQKILVLEIERYEFLSPSELETAPGDLRACSATAAGGGK